ncbi:MAG TPA: hypothetical protein VGE07_19420 [Herpetosiphonaceae bacterium]
MSGVEPAALLLILLATVYGALGHLLWGRRWRHLAMFWGAAFVGCLLMYGLGLRLVEAGPAPAGVPILETTAAAWGCLLIASRLRV